MADSKHRVIDTNVLLVANGQHLEVTPACVISCVQALDRLRSHGIVVIDDAFEILREYANKTAPNTGNRFGDGFLKWLHQNKANLARVEQVPIHTHPERGYQEFPDDDKLGDFDRSDRKFVAVSIAHSGKPAILQATDSKWQAWSAPLAKHEVTVDFLCPDDVEQFVGRKQRKRPS